ncbi:EF hand [Methylobrevis pamukkalensis]|uniref:EF hand n=2 Tax=Methylobrevis pamukkalensis TaxID=1439726 RepID=A0A1E3H4S5_9HYPH|nr:EF hand [Methylobrevis pamukkalensis]
MNIGGTGGYSPAAGLASRILSQADTDVDGALSLEEFAATGDSEASDEDVSDIFSALDADSDGAITGSELASGIEQFSSEAASTLLSLQEFGAGGPPQGGPPPGGPPPGGGGADLFAETDEDESGTLSLEEFSATGEDFGLDADKAEELFNLIDADSDGEITEDENAAFEETKAQSAAGGPPQGGPPPGGPPPGGPPSGSTASSTASSTGGSGGLPDLASLLAGNSAYGSSQTIDLTKLFDQAA